MENASKALIMAATVLIGIMILSLGVYLFATFGSYAAEVDAENRKNQIAQFNSQFLSYRDKADGITVHEIITIANLAKDYNDKNELSQGDEEYITVNAIGGDLSNAMGLNFEQKSKNFEINKYPNLIYVDVTHPIEMRKYDCYQIDMSDITERVKTIYIKPK